MVRGAMIRNGRQHTKPLFIDRLDESGTVRALDPIPFAKAASDCESHDEGWLQRLTFEFPQVLPIGEIEPGFGPLVPVCIELPTSAGSIDNFYVTGNGDLVLAECKLWRNPEARREVVAQIIDYAHSMASWSYDDLENAVRRGRTPTGDKPQGPLFSLIDETEGLGERDFADAVSRNLRLGRLLLLIVGDGVREGVETLTDYLQMHAGFHFTLSIVEMPVFQLPNEGYVVQPRVLARTVNIERGIVRLTDDRLHVEAPAGPSASEGERKRTSISQDRLMEMLARSDPKLPQALDSFLQMNSDLGVYIEPAQKSLQLRWRGVDETVFGVGGVSPDGELLTYNVGWSADGIGRVDLAHEYLENIAKLIGGEVRRTKNPAQWYVVTEGTQYPKVMTLLARPDEWSDVIEAYAKMLIAAV